MGAGPVSAGSAASGAGGSSMMVCAFVPEIPNDDTAARRDGRSPATASPRSPATPRRPTSPPSASARRRAGWTARARAASPSPS
ncbi:hypothetical protein V2I01_30785 [Micromonospora sp. BRA006-A]|nr:hypothetical protein [Micromonospora sp. BRA006-A]